MPKVKSLDDLRKLRDEAKNLTSPRQEQGHKIIVGMGTCGIAAGAREVMNGILEELKKKGITDVNVTQTGCIGMCEKEVLVDVQRRGEDRITYGRVTSAHVEKIIREHLVNGQIVEELVVGRPEQ